ncbi:MAG: NUDIX domain-containing protein [Clostridia bacterium]|nr:NUDIX domain-containing protein [Clostridia bacterium]
MAIRNSAKALVIRDGKILLNRCRARYGVYYALPGGGQKYGETLSDAIKRELLEETGFSVTPQRMAGVYEAITHRRNSIPDHKVYFFFLCTLNSAAPLNPTHRDDYQLSSEWVDLSEAASGRLFPKTVRDNLLKMIYCEGTIYLGSEHKGG